MSDYIKKSLNKIESPLVRQTVEFMISKVEEAPDSETCDIAKSALILYLESAAPHLLKNTVQVNQALNKSDFDILEEELTKSVDFMSEAILLVAEDLMDDLEKHQYKGPKELRPLPHPPHGELQEVHGNRPGKRTVIGLLQAWRKVIDPRSDKLMPSHKELLEMDHEGVMEVAAKFIPVDIITGVGRVIRSVTTGDNDEIRRRSLDGTEAYRITGRGQGRNNRFGEYANALKEMLGRRDTKGQSKRVKVLTEKPRIPGVDVVDYEGRVNPKGIGKNPPSHFKPKRSKNEVQVTGESKVPGTGGGREALGSISRSGSIEDHPEYVQGQPLPGVIRPNPFRPRAKNERERRALAERAKQLDLSGLKDERINIGRRPTKDPFEPMPEIVTSVDQMRNTALYPLYSQLNGAAKKKVSERLAEGGMSPSDLNTYLRGLTDQPVNLTPRRKKARRADLNRQSRARRKERAADESAKEKAKAEAEFRAKNPKPAPSQGEQAVLDALESKTEEILSGEVKRSAKDISRLAEDMASRGTDKDKAIDVLSDAALKLEDIGDQLKALEAEEKELGTDVDSERAQVVDAMNAVLENIRELGYSDLASYFEDKLNIGQTISAIMSSAKLEKSDALDSEAVEKFYARFKRRKQEYGN